MALTCLQESPQRAAPGSPSPRTKRSMQERCAAKPNPNPHPKPDLNPNINPDSLILMPAIDTPNRPPCLLRVACCLFLSSL